MGDKYIIEKHEKDSIWRMYADAYGDVTIEGVDLTPYTEPDLDAIRNEAYEKGVQDTKQHWVDAPRSCAYKLGYENGLNDAWAAARKIAVSVPLGGISQLAIKRMFGVEWQYVLMNCTPAKVIEKLRQREQEQKQEEKQIQVGDEVRNIENRWTAVVCNIDGECMTLMDTNGALGDGYDVNRFTKTGRHFPEIAAVLAKMKEES